MTIAQTPHLAYTAPMMCNHLEHHTDQCQACGLGVSGTAVCLSCARLGRHCLDCAETTKGEKAPTFPACKLHKKAWPHAA